MAATLASLFLESTQRHARQPALKVKAGNAYRSISYRDLHELVTALATGLMDLGIGPGDHVALISDNRLEWIVSDLAVVCTGAVDVPRGSDTPVDELRDILSHSDAVAALVEDEAQLRKVQACRKDLPALRHIVVLDEAYRPEPGSGVLTFDRLLQRGRALRAKGNRAFEERAARVQPQDLATIIYTSGTTGRPKGVMLSHANIMHNVRVLPALCDLGPGDRFLSILPPWHVYERIAEYLALASGASTAYTTRRTLAEDLLLERPTHLASVPRLWETLYTRILAKVRQESRLKQALFHRLLKASLAYRRAYRLLHGGWPTFREASRLAQHLQRRRAQATLAALAPLHRLAQPLFAAIRERTGGCLRTPVSGGGALPAYLDDFFDAIGIPIHEGYGLTETSPVVCVRPYGRDVIHTVGPPLPETQVKIVDAEGREVPRGQQGRILVRGPQVMMGYYKDPGLTSQVLDSQGWFDTGDLGRLSLEGCLAITGRAKDTIVLRGGENVEPEPLENKLCESPFIAQAMVVGQDRKVLAALIQPDFERLQEEAAGRGWPTQERQALLEHPQVQALYRSEIRKLVSPETGFKPHERIARFHLVPEEFRVGEELTHTLKKKRSVIARRYAREIEALYRDDTLG